MGDYVTTSGVVIAVLSDGFYIESSGSTLDTYAESWDSDTCTSEGIYVYTGTGNVPSSVGLKTHVLVYGLVQASNNSSYGGTQIYVSSPSSNISVLSTGNSYPSTVSASVVTSAINNGGCKAFSANSFGQWLPFEGMLINVPSSSTLLVTQGTGGDVTPSSQTATSNGQFWGVITTTTRPFRATGIDVLDPAYANAPSTVTTWTANPQLLLIDSKTVGGTALDASAGTEYTGSSNLVGIVDYHVSTQGYTGLLLTSSAVSSLSSQSGNTPTAAHSRLSSDQITFATLDLNSLVDNETNRMTKLANAIVNYMHSPDVIAVQGADATSLANLPGYITTASGPSYTVTTESSVDSNGLVNAFLVNASKFDGTPTASQALCSTTANEITLPVSGTTENLFDRCPLVLTAKIPRTGISDYTMVVVNANLMDRSDLSVTSTSEDARYRREQQAERLAGLLETYETAGDHVIVMGGFNSFEFSDGYVDTLGIIDGLEASDVTSSTVWTYGGTYNSATLINSTTSATNLSLSEVNPAISRYTYVESGSAEQPDHIIYTSEMSALFSMDYARIGADFPVADTYTTSTVARATNHDAVIAYFTIPYTTMTTVTSSPNPSVYDEPVTFTATVCVTASSSSTTCASGADTPDGKVTFTDTTTGTTMGSVTLSGGVAALSYSALTVGTHTITAAYSGSETSLGFQSSSGTTSQTVNQDPTTATLTSSPNPSYYGEPVTLSATVAYNTYGVTPTGTVTFIDTSNSNATLGTATLSSGAGTLSISTLSVGTHVIQASYGGDTTNATSTSNTVSQVVNTNTTTVTVASSENPSYYGDSVTFTATAVGSYGTPAGTITFYDATTSTILGTATLASGTATYTSSAASSSISTLSVGTHNIQANYGGDGTNAAATGNVSQVVNTNASTLVLTSNNNPSYYGDSVTFTVTATAKSGTPSGTLIIYYGSTALGGASITAGTATLATSTLPVGTDGIYAYYGGDGTHAAATSNTVNQVVQAVYTPASTLSCSPNPAEYGTTVTCTDTVASTAGTPTGTVTFYDGTTLLGTATLSSGVATYSTSLLAVGNHSLIAVYSRNGQYLASTSNTVIEVIISTFALTASPSSLTLYTGETGTSTITVTPGAGFALDVALACSGMPSNATCTISPATVTGGSGTAKLTLTTTAPQQTADARSRSGGRGWPLLATLLVFLLPRRLRRWRGWTLAWLFVVAAMLGAVSGCGGSGTLGGGTAAGTYPVTITGTAVDGTLTITETTTVNLTVKSMF